MLKKLLCLFLVVMLTACSTYKTQFVPFRPPDNYANSQRIAGFVVGGEAFADSEIAREAFGFDIREAGLLPVQIALDNKSGQTLEIVSSQTFLVDKSGRYWNVIPNAVSVERVENYTDTGAIASGAGKGAALGAAAGAILGAALGIVSGTNVGSAFGKGAALGAAGGAIVGGTKEGTAPERGYRIADDIRSKGLEGKAIPDQYLASGFLFFPGEVPSAKELRMQMRERETGTLHAFTLTF